MNCNFHHVHLFASDLNASIQFYTEMFGAEIVFEGFKFRTSIRDFGDLKYIMLVGPDQVLIEVFENKAAWHQAPGR
jgi:catechol 2,3-dioxygenase-like lactoylglutathione lyase family enzyme